jgi:serine phosphatase RsbU (regulator of sigma subunit)
VTQGDVSGKGMPAALVMAALCSEVRYRLATTDSPITAFQQLNVELSKPQNDTSFVTFVLCVLDPGNNDVTIINAGHMTPICRRGGTGQIEEVGAEQKGPPLGCDASIEYQCFTTQLLPGDAIVMYTDGINEAMNPSHDIYGVQRVLKAVQTGPENIEKLCRWLLADVRDFTCNHPQSDDMCLIGIMRERRQEAS